MSLICSSYCIGDSYNLNSISLYLKQNATRHRIYSKEVLHYKCKIPEKQKKYDVFVYSYGCIVFWGISEENIAVIIDELSEFVSMPIKKRIFDECKYTISATSEVSFIDLENDIIVLRKSDTIYFSKLAFSYGLSQSVKLSVFEESVDSTIEDNKKIPIALINTGKISLSSKKLAKKIGVLFAERNYINLNNNILDTPEFFWKNPKYEQYYSMSLKFLDLPQRIHVLNSKLDVIRDLYSILSAELQHAHSSRLEIVVIILISLEICIGVTELLLHGVH